MTMGFRFGRSQGMEGSTSNLNEFLIDPANTNPIFTGDPVVISGGYIEEASGGADNVDFELAGIFHGCSYHDVDGSVVYRQYWDGVAGRSNIKAQVIVPAHAVLLAIGTGYTQADVGTRKGIIFGAGNTATGMSGSQLSAAGANTATAPFTVIGPADIPGVPGEWWEVTVNRQQLTASGA